MATVYGAKDVRHDRPVAVKVLLPELAAAIGAERFLAEIHTTAKLQHPHILPLFDSGAAEGQLYYVMPLVEGESLRERLAREGPLAVDEVARLVGEVGSALDYAHRHGVIHRDVKPANILLHEGNAMLADFGIARAARVDRAGRLTETGFSLGTPQYMSPEQAAGEPDLGAASDLYSLGVVTYELLTGRLPFEGASLQAVLVQLLTAAPNDLAKARADIPGAVNAAVLKALAKRPDDRYPTGAAFAAALRPEISQQSFPATTLTRPPRSRKIHPAVLGVIAAVALAVIASAGWWVVRARGAATAAGPPRLLAVLPITNLTGDSSKNYFGRGLAVEITDELHRLNIGVVGSAASTSAAGRFRTGSDIDVQAAGRALGADAVLDGTLFPSSNGGRLNVELTDVKNQTILWSQQYQLGGDLFAFQDSVARQVASALRVTLTPTQLAAARSGRSGDPVAHDMVVAAKGYAEQRNQAGLDRAISLYTDAIARDSSYADAWAGLAEAYNLRAVFGDVRPGDYFQLAAQAADRALALDSASATAHRARGFVAVFWQHDWAAGRREFDRALALDSLAPSTWLFRTWYFMAMGQRDSQLATVTRARDLDSLAPINATRLADILYNGGDYAAAKRELASFVQHDPVPMALLSLAPVYARLGQCDSALTALGLISPSYGPASIRFRFRVWGRCGQQDRIRQELRSADERAKSGQPVSGVTMAEGAALVGDREGMYRWLDHAVRTRDWQLFFINGDPEFGPYRAEPRFRALLRQLDMPAP
jgi:serine/threonine-protein kinase